MIKGQNGAFAYIRGPWFEACCTFSFLLPRALLCAVPLWVVEYVCLKHQIEASCSVTLDLRGRCLRALGENGMVVLPSFPHSSERRKTSQVWIIQLQIIQLCTVARAQCGLLCAPNSLRARTVRDRGRSTSFVCANSVLRVRPQDVKTSSTFQAHGHSWIRWPRVWHFLVSLRNVSYLLKHDS